MKDMVSGTRLRECLRVKTKIRMVVFLLMMGEQSRAERLFKIMDKDGDGFVTKNVSFSW